MNIEELLKKNPYGLAPLAGYTDLCFRKIIREYTGGFVVTEMVSVAGLSREDKKTLTFLKIQKADHPLALQIFGCKPEEFSASVPYLIEAGADIVDINMGCPVSKIVKQGAGVALMKTPELAKKIIKDTVKASSIPVTVKIRLGWDQQHQNYLEIAKIAEDAGAQAVCLHGRTRSQGFTGVADWGAVQKLKSLLKIPVIGNGDLISLEQAQSMMVKTGCNGVLVGREAVSFFIPEEERLTRFQEHFQYFISEYGEQYFYEMRKFSGWYLKGMPGASHARKLLNEAGTAREFGEILKQIIASIHRQIVLKKK